MNILPVTVASVLSCSYLPFLSECQHLCDFLCLCADLRSVQCHPGPRGHRSGPCWERRHHSRGEIFREAAPSSIELHYSELLSTINCLEMLNQNICSTTDAQTLYWQAKPKQIFLREADIINCRWLLAHGFVYLSWSR